MSAEPGTTAAPDFLALSQEHEAEDGESVAATPTPELPATPAKVETVEAKTDEAAKDEDISKAAGVATPDGKHIIPAAELINARRKNRELADTVEKLSNQLVEATDKLRTAPTATTAAADVAAQVAAAGDDVSAQREALESGLTTIEAEAPWLAKAVRAILEPTLNKLGELGTVKKELTQLKAERDQFIAKSQANEASVIETAIANTPLVAHWQEQGGEAWEEAVRIDNILKTKDAWRDKPPAERFAEVARRVVAVLGDEVAPENLRTKPVQDEINKDAVVAAAKAKLAGATPGISSLSDIPGGTAAAPSLASELADDQVNVGRLEELYRGKKPEDIMQAFRT